jgi:hypothetical protein
MVTFLSKKISFDDHENGDDLCVLTQSSNVSLMAETEKMNNSGVSVVKRPVGDTFGIC